MLQFPEFIFEPLAFLSPGESIYLVGGAIRDNLLGQPLKDLDYAVSEDPRKIARRMADIHNGSFYVLDEDRKAYRVLLKRAGHNSLNLDFIQMRGDSIQADLLERDFTINAMALDLANPDSIIDPLKGGRDLQQKFLKLITPNSLLDDPVRVIRAVRYAANLQLKMDRETILSIKTASEYLDKVSVERKRDEVFKIISNHHLNSAIQLLHRLDVLPKLGIPVQNEIENSARVMEILDEIFQIITQKVDPNKNQAFQVTSLQLKLSRFEENLSLHYLLLEPTGRTRREIVLFSLLLADGISRDSLARFALSIDEIEIVTKLQQLLPFTVNLLLQPGKLSNRDVYRFFLVSNQCGIDLILQVLAKSLARLPDGNTQQTWLNMLDRAEQCFETWFKHPEQIHPRPFLSGTDLMFQFDLPPGPFIGELLDGLKEEQAAGVVTSVSDAVDWVESRLIKFK